MSEENIPEIAPDIFVGYFAHINEFHAVLDADEHCPELTQELYARVSKWTRRVGMVLGEGYTKEWYTHSDKYPASISLHAPIIDAGSTVLGTTWGEVVLAEELED